MRNNYNIVQCTISGLVFILFFSFQISAQSIWVSFTGISPNSATTYDSVLVQNLTKGSSMMVYPGDNLLLGHLGINNNNHRDANVNIYPNPCKSISELKFSTFEKGSILVSIFDISGRKIISTSNELEIGKHSYSISGLHQGIYFVQICGKEINHTLKLISQSFDYNEANIEYTGSLKISENQVKLKSSNSTVFMEFSFGDQMLYLGYSYIYKKIVTDIPSFNSFITFYFWQCTDVENHNYATVDIGNQTWMAENINSTRFRNGDTIQNTTDNAAWNILTSASYCNFNNTTVNSDSYGKLYNFYVISDTRRICPLGWHIPSDTAWTEMTNYLGGEYIAGNKLKETAATHWQSSNTASTNESGFTALPGGDRGNGGSFYDKGNYGFWWSSNQDVSNKAWIRYMQSANGFVSRLSFGKNYGFSVRCLKD
ncbi:MAG: FISUMP domain-containing protein [Bacteroidales bacterium]